MDALTRAQVGVPRQYPAVSPLSLWERARVRAWRQSSKRGTRLSHFVSSSVMLAVRRNRRSC